VALVVKFVVQLHDNLIMAIRRVFDARTLTRTAFVIEDFRL
jgi:hypothetical protein